MKTPNQSVKLNKAFVQTLFSSRSRITVQGLRMLSEDAVCGRMETVAVQLVVCIRNQRPPLLEWEADVSEEFSWLQQFFLFSCLSFERCLSPSPSLLLSLSLCCIYPPCTFFFFCLFFYLWHILYLKLFLNQRGDRHLRLACSFFPKQRKFFFGSIIQQLDIETLCPSDVNGGGKEWEREV